MLGVWGIYGRKNGEVLGDWERERERERERKRERERCA